MMRALLVGAVWAEALLASLLAYRHSAWWWGVVAVLAVLAAVGTWDLVQTRHSILRAFPILGHSRYIAELIRPGSGSTSWSRTPRARRSTAKRGTASTARSKGTKGDEPFGTERDVNAIGYEFLRHSMRAKMATDLNPGSGWGPDCTQPYDIALLNVSAMSFGSLSGNAIEALNAALPEEDSPTTPGRAASVLTTSSTAAI